MGGGIVVCGYRLSDMTATDLAFNLNGSAHLLVIAPPEQLDFCEGDNIFRLQTPTTRADVNASVRMLEQMEQMQLRKTLPQRDETEKAIVAQAKALLMDKHRMTEPEAHKYIQRKSMESGVKMADTARKILQSVD
jgi:response regulator NasT